MLTVFFFPKKNHQVLLFIRARLPRKTCFCIAIDLGSKGGAGESTRLPSMWPGFKSRRRRHMWVEFVVGSLLCCERFFSGYSGFPLSSKTNISNSNSTRNQVDEEPLCGCATCKSLFIYLSTLFYLGPVEGSVILFNELPSANVQ